MPTLQKPDCKGRKFVKVCSILETHGHNPARLVPILSAVQEEYRYLPQEVLTYIATALDISPARVFGVATFYGHFAIQPKGKHIVRLCDGTACHVKDSIPILEAIRKHLGLEGKQTTTNDMMFTVETVACLGACGLAPVVVIDEQVHGQVTPEGGVQLVEEIIAKEQAE